MKKTILLLFTLIFTVISAFALSNPRWDVRPIKVYIAGNDYKAQWMKSAFQEWQTKTYSAVWFVFLGANKQNEADITVNFVEFVHCNNPSAIGCTHSRTQNGFYTHNDVEIGSKYVIELKGDDGTVAKKTVTVSNDALYGIMLHEIGHAIGITEHSKDVNSVMYAYSMHGYKIPQHLTKEDLRLVYKTYR